MKNSKTIAAAVLVTTTMAAPAFARECCDTIAATIADRSALP